MPGWFECSYIAAGFRGGGTFRGNSGFNRAANSPAGRQAAETAKAVGEDVTDFADDLSRKASKQFARAQDMAGDVYDNAHAAVRRDPVTALAIALGIGFLFGVVVGTRR